MFDQLDDTTAFVPDVAFRSRVRRRARQLHRRRRAVRVGVVGALPLAGLGAFGWSLRHQLDSVQRVSIGTSDSQDPLDAGRPVVVLLAGNDLSRSDPRRAGVVGSRDDTIIVARIDPAHHSLATLPIPRDLWTGSQKVDQLSPSDLVAWIESNLGVHVDHYLSIDMDGFGQIANLVAPKVDLRYPIRDRNTGLSLDAGCHALTGSQTLAYLRSRHLEERQLDGHWIADPTGDLGRMDRTQSLEAALLPQLHRIGALQLDRFVDALARSATVDRGFTDQRLLELADLARSVTDVNTMTLPTRPGSTAPPDEATLAIDASDPSTAEVLSRMGGRLSPSLTIPTNDASRPGAITALGRMTTC